MRFKNTTVEKSMILIMLLLGVTMIYKMIVLSIDTIEFYQLIQTTEVININWELITSRLIYYLGVNLMFPIGGIGFIYYMLKKHKEGEQDVME